ncbi:MAG: LysM peptidoglycan-binding domain-containing protein [Synergistaceae bacterium]|jgi:proteasome lid subunit RPN8/RPN11|nr:LysM peptidoglycan-binding domain-containing protein [Synergistaceae bacterium]
MNELNQNEVGIEIQDGVERKAGVARLPVNFVLSGTVENDDVKVYIHQKAYKAIEKYAHSDTSKELGSILIGDYTEYSGKTQVVIQWVIEAKYTDASASTLTFTHETWNYVYKEQSRLFPDLKILGWQHTHPGYGIFLSNYDMFIQENFFNLPFQVAYVVDPKQDIRGFFQWKNGKVEKLNGFYIFDEVDTRITIEPDIKLTDAKVTDSSGRKILLLLYLLLLIVGVLSISAVLLYFNKQQEKLQEDVEEIFTVLQQEISIHRDNLTELRREFTSKPINSDDEHEKAINADSGEDVLIGFVQYTVQRGDTLMAICSKHKIEYSANRDVIKAVNRLGDTSTIRAGQVILLPIKVQGLRPPRPLSGDMRK